MNNLPKNLTIQHLPEGTVVEWEFKHLDPLRPNASKGTAVISYYNDQGCGQFTWVAMDSPGLFDPTDPLILSPEFITRIVKRGDKPLRPRPEKPGQEGVYTRNRLHTTKQLINQQLGQIKNKHHYIAFNPTSLICDLMYHIPEFHRFVKNPDIEWQLDGDTVHAITHDIITWDDLGYHCMLPKKALRKRMRQCLPRILVSRKARLAEQRWWEQQCWDEELEMYETGGYRE